MTQQVTLDRDRTAVVIIGYQERHVNSYTSDPEAVIRNAGQVLVGARQAGIPVIHVVHRGGNFEDYSPDVEIHSGVAPAPGEEVFTKTRTGSFSTTGLDASLRVAGRDALVLMGIATSGGVLSTVRWGYDVGYNLFVVSDACSDLDQELHRVLMEKLYPRQATILTAQTFLKVAGVA